MFRGKLIVEDKGISFLEENGSVIKFIVDQVSTINYIGCMEIIVH